MLVDYTKFDITYNTPPNVTQPTINDTTPYTNEIIKCNNGTFSDADGDSNSGWHYRWYDTGSLISDENQSTLNLSKSGLNKADNITCSIRAYDGTDYSAWSNSSNSAIIENSIPAFSTTPINHSLNTTTSFSYDINCTDLDIDTLTYSLNDTTTFSISNSTGIITSTIDEYDSGIHNLQTTCSDGEDNVSANFTITVNDTTDPRISIYYPESVTYTNNNTIPLNFSAVDATLDSCWYQVINSTGNNAIANTTLAGCNNLTFSLPGVDEDYTLYLYTNDSYGNIASDSVLFGVRVTAPSVVLNFPTQALYFPLHNATFNATATDSDNISTCRLYGNWSGSWGVKETKTGILSGTKFSFASVYLNDSRYAWNVWCNDTLGNGGFAVSNKTFTVDTTYPTVAISNPSSGESINTSFIMQYNITEINPSSCSYNFKKNDGSWMYSPNQTLSCTGTNATVSIVAGTYTLFIYAIDFAGNSNSSNVNFTVSSAPTVVVVTTSGGGGSTTTNATPKKFCNITFNPQTVLIYPDIPVVMLSIINHENFSISPIYVIDSSYYEIVGVKNVVLGQEELSVSVVKHHSRNGSFIIPLVIKSAECKNVSVNISYVDEKKFETLDTIFDKFFHHLLNTKINIFGLDVLLGLIVAGVAFVIGLLIWMSEMETATKIAVGMLMIITSTIFLTWYLPNHTDVVNENVKLIKEIELTEVTKIPDAEQGFSVKMWMVNVIVSLVVGGIFLLLDMSWKLMFSLSTAITMIITYGIYWMVV